jgi:trehalose-6-phosphatase
VEQALDKGDALAAERDRLACNWVLYAGDDENDEDAFALSGNIISVRIGRNQRSHARYYLGTQVEIDELIALLVMLREPVRRQ